MSRKFSYEDARNVFLKMPVGDQLMVSPSLNYLKSESPNILFRIGDQDGVLEVYKDSKNHNNGNVIIFVDPQKRGQSIGVKLLFTALDKIRKEKLLKKLTYRFDIKNNSSRKLISKFNNAKIGRIGKNYVEYYFLF